MQHEVRLTLRLPGNLHTRLVQTSHNDTRSLNSQIVSLLREALEVRDRRASFDRLRSRGRVSEQMEDTTR